MDLFTVIEDANAIVRAPKGVLKQTKLYRRGERLFIPYGGGFIRVTAKFGDSWGTSHPDVKVVEFDAVPGLGNVDKEPRFTAPMRVAA